MENLFIHEAPGCDKSMLETMVAEGDFRAYAELARCYLKKVFPSYEEFLEGKKLLEQGAAKGDDNAMAPSSPCSAAWRYQYLACSISRSIPSPNS